MQSKKAEQPAGTVNEIVARVVKAQDRNERRRIAESWLLSKQTPAIEAETSGPDIPAVKLLENDGVREIPPKSAKEIPVRKRIKPVQKHRDLDF